MLDGMSRDAFFLRVANALSGCQLVEQELKAYITAALDLVSKRVEGQVPFKMSGRDYDDAPLGRLIDAFKKLSDNSTLVEDLNKFKKERDFLSHKGISHCLDMDGELDGPATADFEGRLRKMIPEAERLRSEIHNSAHGVLAHLWFDAVPPKT